MVRKCDFRLHDWIDGKYKVERVLGHSKYDSKFKVVDKDGNQYMLKLLKLWLVDSSRQATMSARSESEISSCIIPSNYLTHIVGKGMVSGNPYLLIEFTPSIDLSRMSFSKRPDVGDILAKILFGLKDLHVNGKVHCNLTAENVLMTDDDRVLLTNYVVLGDRNQSLSEHLSSASRQMPMSAAYVAPERYGESRCATILPSVDIFAFGVLTYQMLTGRLPFGSLSNSIEYQNRALAGNWNRNILGRDTLKWEPFFDSVLSPIPSNRSKSADEVLEILPVGHSVSYEKADGTKEFDKSAANGILLRVMQGDEFGKIYRLGELSSGGSRRILTAGREDASTFNVIPIREATSTYISRRHCTIELDGKTGKLYIRDGQWDKEARNNWVNSLNGTFVNSDEVTMEGCEIVPGDIISVGDVKLRVEGY